MADAAKMETTAPIRRTKLTLEIPGNLRDEMRHCNEMADFGGESMKLTTVKALCGGVYLMQLIRSGRMSEMSMERLQIELLQKLA